MAIHPLQAESVSANPPLSLHTAACEFENISGNLAELSALVYLASRAEDLDEMAGKALRAIVTQLDEIVCEADRQSEAFLAAARSAKG